VADERIAQLISEKLRDGIIHPGYPDRDVPPKPIMLPFKKTAGMPKEMSDLMAETAKQLAEAIVDLIEGEGNSDIVPKDEVRSMRRAAGAGDPVSTVPVYCRCNRNRDDPLAILSVTDPAAIIVDGGTLIRGLAKRSPTCPHGVIE